MGTKQGPAHLWDLLRSCEDWFGWSHARPCVRHTTRGFILGGEHEDGDSDAGLKDATTRLILGNGQGIFLQNLDASSRQITNFTVYYF